MRTLSYTRGVFVPVIYGYRCAYGHEIDVDAPAGNAPRWVRCCCLANATRDYSGVRFASDDQFRRAWLSDKIGHELGRQERTLDPLAPKDKFEARHVADATGRVYIGDDTSMLKPASQRAIERGKGKARI